MNPIPRLRALFSAYPLRTMAIWLALVVIVFLTRNRWEAWVESQRFRLAAPALWDSFVALGGRRALIQAGDNSGYSWHLYDLTSGRKIGEVAGGIDRRFLVTSPAGDRTVVLPMPKKNYVLEKGRISLAPGEPDLTPYVVDLVSGARLLELKGHPDCAVHAEHSPDGGSIATSGLDRTVRVWDAVTGECRLSFRTGEAHLYHAKWSRDGRRILTQSAHRHGTCTWDAETGSRLADFPGFPVFCAGGRRVVTFAFDAGVYDSDTGSQVAPFPGNIRLVAVSTDETRIATLDRTGVIRVWDAETGAMIASSPLDEPFTGAQTIVFSADGRTVAVTESRLGCGAVDAATGSVLYRLRPGLKTLRFSPRGTRILAMDDMSGLLHIWDARTGRPLASIHATRFLGFLDENKFLASRTSLAPSNKWVNDAVFYRRIRPEQWWGVLHLWHFWIVAALGVVLALSVWKDARDLRRARAG